MSAVDWRHVVAPVRRIATASAPAVLAMALAVTVSVLGWQGGDHAAQAYRVSEVSRFGIVIWDSGWYGGSFPLSYSVLFPVLGAFAGIAAVAVVSAGMAAWAFDRLVTSARGARPWGSWYFAISTVLAVSVGQLPYLCGEAAGLVAVWALARRRVWTALLATIVAVLCSPLAGAFLVLICAVGLLAGWARRLHLVAVVGLAAAGILAVGAAFPGTGPFPFPWSGLAIALGVCAALAVAYRHDLGVPAVPWTAGAYALACVASFVVANPLGGNAPRLAAEIGVPILACVGLARLSPATGLRPGRLIAGVGVLAALVVWQWSPGVRVDTAAASTPSDQAAFYRPLIAQLAVRQSGPLRAEVVPTRSHWEAARLAPRISLARGWERQLDLSRNSLFYRPHALDAASYQQWLVANGVTWVALPAAPLDYSARGEAALLATGTVADLRLVWTSPQWRLWAVTDSPGLVSGPGHLTGMGPDHLSLQADDSASFTIRIRFMRYWQVSSGHACVADTSDGWTELRVSGAGPVTLHASLWSYDAAICSS